MFRAKMLFVVVGICFCSAVFAQEKLDVKGPISAWRLNITGTPDPSINARLYIWNAIHVPRAPFGPPQPTHIPAEDYYYYFDLAGVGGNAPLAYVKADSGQVYFAGAVGIGTQNPGAGLEVSAKKDRNGVVGNTSSDGFYGVVGKAADKGWGGLFQFGSDGNNAAYFGGKGQAASFIGPVSVKGLASVSVLQITGGSDVAEPFHVGPVTVPKGAVIVIDDEHPGQLKLSDRPYDTRVAGVVSGANGIEPGISLRLESFSQRGQDVALSGRVFALADASEAPIKPGDLLTTSRRPGYCMKAVDKTRTSGAVVGKAMSPLEAGTGMILILVSLQ